MKLLKLSSSNPNFKTLEFKDGLNIVAGLQLTKEEKATINGVGKSFSLNLIHLMFGAKLDKKKTGEKKISDFLADYGSFQLEFSHKKVDYVIEKDFSQPRYLVNGAEILQKDYPGELRKIFLSSLTDTTLNFKQLLNIFARRYRGTYYSDAVSQQGQSLADYYQKYGNLLLLGIDMQLVRKKAQVKEKITQLRKVQQSVRQYESSLEKVNLKDLKDELSELTQQKEKFIIAENYDRFKQEADEITIELNELRNRIHNIQKQLIRKTNSLNQSKSVDIDVERVKRIYDEANFFFADKVSVRLDEANEFHVKLMNSRMKRLKTEIETLKGESNQLKSTLQLREKVRDSILKDLNSKGALEEYNSINERVRTIEGEVHELEKYKKILDGFESDQSNLQLENAEIQAESIKYLNRSKENIESIDNDFRTLVKKFYNKHGGSLQIKSTKDAKYLFDVDVHVAHDGSQGVGEVKIFCYDFLLYQLNPDLLNFIAHDGCIFSEMDPRQKSMIFKVALEYTKNSSLQYFVNIGEPSLKEVLDKEHEINILTDDEKDEITKSVILELYDKDPSSWLFGTSFG